MSKYVPPHLRNQSPREIKERRDDSKAHQYPGPRRNTRFRRDLSEAPQFNVKTESTQSSQPQKQIHPIEIVEKVATPIVVMPPAPNTESPYKEAIQAGLELDINETSGVKDLPIVRRRWEPSSKEIELFKQLAEARNKWARRIAEEEFDQWVKHYYNDLQIMYEQCIDPRLGITFQHFVEAAYVCTDTEYDPKKFKRTRPLL